MRPVALGILALVRSPPAAASRGQAGARAGPRARLPPLTQPELRAGDELDGSRVLSAERIAYTGDTWDLLPAGPTGVYWAGGVPLRSTLWSGPHPAGAAG